MQMMWRETRLAAVLVFAASVAAGAQDRARLALDVGSQPALAVLWKLDERVAVRPDLTFLHVSGDNIQSAWRFGAGASVLYSLRQAGALTTYLGGRGAYAWYSQPNAPTDWSITGIFGARYSLDRHFGISAETGVIYDKLTLPTSPFSGRHESTVAPWGRVSGLLYF